MLAEYGKRTRVSRLMGTPAHHSLFLLECEIKLQLLALNGSENFHGVLKNPGLAQGNEKSSDNSNFPVLWQK